jgi:hypothetical protein
MVTAHPAAPPKEPRRGGDAGAQSGRLRMGDRIRPP